MADSTVQLGSLTLRNPILSASGTCGYGVELLPHLAPEALGAICTKGLSLAPRPGAAVPRLWEVPGGLLNAIGLANIGVTAFIEDKLPQLRARGVTVIANVLGVTPEEFAELANRLDGAAGVAALELNLSCPNVKAGGINLSRDPQKAAEAVRAARSATLLPLIVKLSPEGDPLAIARATAEAGADAFSVCNTIRGLAIDIASRRPRLGAGYGGLSGPALRSIAVRLVHEVSRAVPLPVIGVGGVMTWQDAVEMMLAGATAVQVGTALLSCPRAPLDILAGLEVYLDEHSEAARDLVGRVSFGD